LGNLPDPGEVLEIILLYSRKMQDKKSNILLPKKARASMDSQDENF